MNSAEHSTSSEDGDNIRNESEVYQINESNEIDVCVTCYFIKLVMCLAFYIDQWGRFASMNSLDSAFY